MLERLLKPTSKDQSGIRRSMKRPRDETSPTEIKMESTPAKIANSHVAENGTTKHIPVKPEPVTPSVKDNIDVEMNELNDDDMDFSMLDDEENQFSEQMADTSTSNESNVNVEQIKAELVKKENENYAKLLSNWENTFANENDADDELLGSIDVDTTQSSITSSVDGKTAMKFWYWDAYEDPIKLPGKIFLFGKMASDQNPKEFKSVCITVEDAQRCLYLLPRKYVRLILFHSAFIS